MGAAWLTLRADLRRGWRPMLGMVLLIGLVSGVVLVAAAGARRTSTAYPRLLRWASAAQLDLVPGPPRADYAGQGRAGYYAAVARLPQVASVSAVDLLGLAVQPPHGPPDPNINTTGSLDTATGLTVNRVQVLAGRLYDPADPRAVMIDQRMAGLAQVGPGGTLHVLAIPGYTSAHPDVPGGKRLTLRVSAIVRFGDGIVPDNAGSAEPRALFSPAFVRRYVAGRYPWLAIGDYAGVRLRPGASLASFTRDARSLARQFPAIRPEVVALAAFAVLAGLIGLVILAQLLGWQVSLDAADYPTLRALGASRGTLAATSLLRVGAATLGGGLLGVGLAIAASPLMPVGLARLAEPDPGIEVNLAILGAGLAVAAVAPLLLVFPAAWRAASPAAGLPGATGPAYPARPSRLGSALGLAGAVTGGLGVRDTPLFLGALLGLLAVGTLSHALLAGVRRRYRDLALLKTLGLLRGQLLRVVFWEASTLAGAALLAGLPLGVLAGRWAWVIFARSAGVASQADVPVPLVLLAIPATLLLANLIAAGPGWTAARVPAATVLRAE